jgi:hypothetical protein
VKKPLRKVLEGGRAALQKEIAERKSRISRLQTDGGIERAGLPEATPHLAELAGERLEPCAAAFRLVRTRRSLFA